MHLLSWLCPTTYPDVVCRSNYSTHHYDPPLLYDLNSDPGELYNLDVDEYTGVLATIEKVRFQMHTHTHTHTMNTDQGFLQINCGVWCQSDGSWYQ